MTVEQFRMFQVTYLVCGTVVGIFVGAPIWCAIATRVLRKRMGFKDEDSRVNQA